AAAEHAVGRGMPAHLAGELAAWRRITDGPVASTSQSRAPRLVLGQASNWVPIVDMMRPIGGIKPSNSLRQTEGAVDRGGHVFRRLRAGRGKGAVFVRGANDRSSANAATREEDRLHGSPVVATRQLDPWNIQR